MLSNNQIKEIRSLKHKKFRQKYDKFVVEGHKSSAEFLRSQKYPIKTIFALDSWIEYHKNLLHPFSQKVVSISQIEMGKISMLKTHSDVLLVCQISDADVNLQLNECPAIFFLDNIQDPGNVGTIIRIADWFGIKAIISAPGTSDVYGSKVIQASMGSICNVDIFYGGPEIIKAEGLDHAVVGTDINGHNLTEFNWPNHVIVVLGNEGRGISDHTKTFIDNFVTIKGAENRIADSLNVANAASIIANAIYSQ